MAPKMKKLVRAYLNWRKKNPGQGTRGVQQAIKMMGLSPRDGNQLIDTLNDMVKKGQMPKHLAIDEQAKYDYGTPGSVKLMKKITPGQRIDEEDYDRKRDRQAERGTRKVRFSPGSGSKRDPDSTRKAYAAAIKNIKKGLNKESVKPTTAQIRLGRAAKKAGVGKHDDFYKSQMDPETRKKYEPAKRPPPAQVKKPVGTFKWFATRDMKKDG